MTLSLAKKKPERRACYAEQILKLYIKMSHVSVKREADPNLGFNFVATAAIGGMVCCIFFFVMRCWRSL